METTDLFKIDDINNDEFILGLCNPLGSEVEDEPFGCLEV